MMRKWLVINIYINEHTFLKPSFIIRYIAMTGAVITTSYKNLTLRKTFNDINIGKLDRGAFSIIGVIATLRWIKSNIKFYCT